MNLPQQTSLPHAFLFYHIQFALSTLLQNFYKMQACLAETRCTVSRKSIFMIASPERGDSPRGGEMPAGQRGPLSTRGTSEAGGGVPTQSVTSRAVASKPSGGIRSYLAVRLGLANAASCLQCCFSRALLVQTVNFI